MERKKNKTCSTSNNSPSGGKSDTIGESREGEEKRRSRRDPKGEVY